MKKSKEIEVRIRKGNKIITVTGTNHNEPKGKMSSSELIRRSRKVGPRPMTTEELGGRFYLTEDYRLVWLDYSSNLPN